MRRRADAPAAVTPAARPAAWQPWLAALLGALCFINSVGNDLTYDDVPIVADNQAIRSITDWRSIWLSDWWRPHMEAETQRLDLRRDRLYRPLTLLTFAVQYAIHGVNPAAFHAINVALHALCSALVWLLARRLLRDPVAPLVAALLFAVHPVHAEAVANVVGRAEVLTALWLLLGLLVLTAGPASPLRTCAAGLLFLGALFAKETAVCYLPVALLAMHATPSAAPPHRRAWATHALLLLAPLLVYLPLRFVALEYNLIRDAAPADVFNPVVAAEGLSRVLMPLVVLGHYARLMLYPVHLSADYGLRILDPHAFDPLSLLGAAALAGLALCLFGYRRPAGAWRDAAVAAAIFLASYALISNTVLLIGVSLAERLFYWPSVPLCLLLAAVLCAAWRSACRPGGPAARVAVPAAVGGVLVLAALGVRSALRSADWRANAVLFQEDAFTWPRSAVINRFYAGELLRLAGRVAEPQRSAMLRQALRAAGRAIELAPRDADSLLILANIHAALGDAQSATHYAESVLTLAPGDPHARRLTARLLRPDGAAELARLEARVAESPEDAAARVALGRLLVDLARPRDALPHAERAAALAPDDADALRLLAELCAVSNRREEAERLFARITKLDPADWRAHANLTTLLGHDRPAEALRHAEAAHRIAPGEYATNVNLAEALEVNGRITEALERYRLIERGLQADDARLAQVRERIAELRRKAP
ncbi:MAG: tetratricopeptide repeat protein [Phycisphaerales bacterium]|nr:tetratricopeptide repeat protein [Phycisphaerales bacterium]